MDMRTFLLGGLLLWTVQVGWSQNPTWMTWGRGNLTGQLTPYDQQGYDEQAYAWQSAVWKGDVSSCRIEPVVAFNDPPLKVRSYALEWTYRPDRTVEELALYASDWARGAAPVYDLVRREHHYRVHPHLDARAYRIDGCVRYWAHRYTQPTTGWEVWTLWLDRQRLVPLPVDVQYTTVADGSTVLVGYYLGEDGASRAKKFERRYDSAGRLLARTLHGRHLLQPPTRAYPVVTDEYTYDAQGQLVLRTRRVTGQRPIAHHYTYTDLDAQGNWQRQEVRDAAGQLVLAFERRLGY